MNILAIIPARGGSKGVLRKNLQEVGGVPLVLHALKCGMENSDIMGTIVSTDDAEIAEVCKKAGGNVPFIRPTDLSGDDVPTCKVLQHAVAFHEKETGKIVDAVVTLQPTTPLRTSKHVKEAVEIFKAIQPKAECLISVCRAEQHHPLTLYTEKAGALSPLMEGLDPNTRRQDFPPVYWRNGAIYITPRDFLFAQNRTTSDKPLMYEMPEEISVNIDNQRDLEFANFLWARLHQDHEPEIQIAAN